MGKKSKSAKSKQVPSISEDKSAPPPPPPAPGSSSVFPSLSKHLPHGIKSFDMSKIAATLASMGESGKPAVDDPYGLTCLRSKNILQGNPNFWWVYDECLSYIGDLLTTNGYAVIDGFFNGDNSEGSKTSKFRDEVKGAYEAGKLPEIGGLVDGRDGKNTSYATSEIRGDYIGWFDGKESEGWDPALFPDYVLKVSTLVNELKEHVRGKDGAGEANAKALDKVTSRSRCMVTCYPKGGKYTKHVDNGGSVGNGRRLTCLFYLNEEWAPGDGGELKVYERGGKVVKDGGGKAAAAAKQPALQFVPSSNDAAREPDGSSVSPMVCTNEPFLPAGREPALFVPARAAMSHELAAGEGEFVIVVKLADVAPATLAATALDVAGSEVHVRNAACEPAEIRVDLGEEIDAGRVKAKFSKKKGTLKITVGRKL
ncbi:hypothetical protein TeGR_g14306 [Tetraparma gracilis]|uniref:Prolyl 4-hydroxylase alpha subunit domain-containing protein n=1 Tax=Tetraparma gracilis TaxID=2962635 RepID=A0ABQ6MPS9_9STRA|nr:hypothetical protein TeGR_g14306 [Tetraparma gracilis]